MRNPDRLPANMQSKIEETDCPVASLPGLCWTWQNCLNSRGYGCVSVNGKVQLTHRVSYTVYKGEIPDGLQVDHLCRNKACCNPDHLEAVTGKINCERTEAATKMRCVHGHALAGRNLIIKQRTNGRYMRNCRICQLDCKQRNRLKRGESTRTRSVEKKRAELVAESEAALKILRPEPTVIPRLPVEPEPVEQPTLFEVAS